MTYFFVGGSQRSGTTVLQSVLCADAETNPMIHEASYFRAMIEAYQRGKAIVDSQAGHYFTDRNDLCRFNASWVEAFLKMTLERYPPAKHLVLKEPHLTILFPEIFELAPDSRFIVIVRDPRDVIASMLTVGERLAQQGVESKFAKRDVAELVNVYKSFYAPCMNYRSEDFRQQILLLRYEQLVTEPLVAFDKLRDFTGLKLENADPSKGWKLEGATPSDKAQESPASDTKLAPVDDAWGTSLHGNALSPESIGRYQQVLSAEEIQTIETEGADAFRLFNYPVHT
ncbi:MAG: sulfotransferase [Rhodospirillaceae bacterium]|nr:sulfotransferase [Rhodospirillaceae bacterium]